MLRAVFFCTLVIAAPTALASLDEGPTGGKPYTEQMDTSNETFLAALRQRLQQKGFDEVQIVPQMFVVFAKEQGRHVTLVVDSDSLRTMRVRSEKEDKQACPAPNETNQSKTQ